MTFSASGLDAVVIGRVREGQRMEVIITARQYLIFRFHSYDEAPKYDRPKHVHV